MDRILKLIREESGHHFDPKIVKVFLEHLDDFIKIRDMQQDQFTDGNTIWVRPMNPDFSFAGEARQQFSSQPGTWETMDNRVAEGPFVIKYHGRYYMMYNANHTAAEYGNYRLGVCEADSPMGFNPGGKYPWPVVSPQTELLENTFTDLMRYGSKGYTSPAAYKAKSTFAHLRPHTLTTLKHIPCLNLHPFLTRKTVLSWQVSGSGRLTLRSHSGLH